MIEFIKKYKYVILFIVVCVIMLVCLSLSEIYRKVIYLPYKTTHDEQIQMLLAYSHKTIGATFEGDDGNTLHGFLYDSKHIPFYDKNKPIVLYCHGNTGWIGSYINAHIFNYLNKFAPVFAFDYRGYGASTGTPSDDGVCNDAYSAWKYLVYTKNINPKNIIIYGHSLGTVIASTLVTRLIKEQHIMPKALVLEAPFISIKEMAKNISPMLSYAAPSQFDNMKNLEIITKSEKYNVPVYIMHSSQDEVIPIYHSQKLCEIFNLRLYLTEGCHSSCDYTPEITKIFNDITQQ
jgi:uncharacterized protein